MSDAPASTSRVLEVAGLRGGYGQIQVLHGLDFNVDDGEIVVILGANGAGKTTTLRAISGMIETSGTINLHGESIQGSAAPDIVRKGVAHVPQGRGTLAARRGTRLFRARSDPIPNVCAPIPKF